jgi:hypothetical protein
MLKAFEAATGWLLEYQPLQGNSAATSLAGPMSAALRRVGKAVWTTPLHSRGGGRFGQLSLRAVERAEESLEDLACDSGKKETRDTSAAIEFSAAKTLALSIAGMLEELLHTRTALAEREAELAAGVPLLSNPQEKRHLAIRLETVLAGGAEAVGCQAAAIYLLDEATSRLKLRSCWGLPMDRLTAPARPLKGAVADLESLLGHAVVLQDTSLMPSWNVPEDYPAAVCVPVSTSTTILGT